MKKLPFFAMLIFIGLILQSSNIIGQQKTLQYKTIANIHYYSETQIDYMKERCVLDLYYPENTADFITVVWFHGGGFQKWNVNPTCGPLVRMSYLNRVAPLPDS